MSVTMNFHIDLYKRYNIFQKIMLALLCVKRFRHVVVILKGTEATLYLDGEKEVRTNEEKEQ